MNDVQFEDESNLRSSFKSRAIWGTPTTPKMVRALLRAGIVKNEKQAGKLLLLISICCFLLSILIFLYIANDGFKKTIKLTPTDILKIQAKRERQLQQIKRPVNSISTPQ